MRRRKWLRFPLRFCCFHRPKLPSHHAEKKVAAIPPTFLLIASSVFIMSTALCRRRRGLRGPRFADAAPVPVWGELLRGGHRGVLASAPPQGRAGPSSTGAICFRLHTSLPSR
jgi:hypothetical protein